MKATNLMIGDYIQDLAGDLCQVIVLDRHVAQVETLTGVHQGDTTRYLHEAEGVPLTPEILEKIGLEEYGRRGLEYQYWEPLGDKRAIFLEKMPQDDYWYGFVGSGLPDNLDCNEPDTVFKHFSYVHELQHALRLCGIEKEIIL